LYNDLAERFGKEALFRDLEIGPGLDFVDVITKSIERCNAVLVVIGARWLEDKPYGQRRIDQESDVVRQEILAALRTSGKRAEMRVIPVLIQQACLPQSEMLPDQLRPLVRRNAIELSDTRWKEDVEKLIATLSPLLQTVSADGAMVAACRNAGSPGCSSRAGYRCDRCKLYFCHACVDRATVMKTAEYSSALAKQYGFFGRIMGVMSNAGGACPHCPPGEGAIKPL
jgi:hypothetical protein